jgi:uncharacterized protein (DUF58 family)
MSAPLRLRAEAAAAELPPLLVAAERVASLVSQGVHGRRRVGQGETFWQFRRYQPGDSSQRIDWRQSAKSVPVYIRETEWEAAQSVWLWRDASPSMRFTGGRDRPEKAERANLLLLALASLLVRGGEHIAMLGSGLPPSTGRGALNRLAALIEDRGGTVPSVPPVEPLPRYARTVLFGDFLSPLEDIRRSVEGLAGRGLRGHLVQVMDPVEEALPFDGRVHFQGLEQEGDIVIGRVEAIRPDYQALLADHREALREMTRAVGWTFAIHRTDQPPQAALLALFVTMTMNAGF